MEPPKRRRTWLWVILAVIGGFVLLCCVVLVLASTSWGAGVFGDFGTRIADFATEVAPTPGP